MPFTGVISRPPMPQKPMVAHLRDVPLQEESTSSQTTQEPAEKEPSLWMRGGGVIGDCVDAIVCFECCKGCCECCC